MPIISEDFILVQIRSLEKEVKNLKGFFYDCEHDRWVQNEKWIEELKEYYTKHYGDLKAGYKRFKKQAEERAKVKILEKLEKWKLEAE